MIITLIIKPFPSLLSKIEFFVCCYFYCFENVAYAVHVQLFADSVSACTCIPCLYIQSFIENLDNGVTHNY